MSFSKSIFKNEERAMYELRRLYEQYGYARYKVSKFEEYDLYARNKSFLISENILTFTDINGKLMALKPDITLSIVKNVRSEDADPHKLYYNENVYRTSQGSDGFREIMQTGLECIGQIDLYSMGEVLMLAKRSLALISPSHILDISHMGFLRAMLEEAGVSEADAPAILREIGNKNTSAIRALVSALKVSEQTTEELCALTELYEPLAVGLEKIRPMVRGARMQEAFEQLCEVLRLLRASGDDAGVNLDFSMINDMRYYNGIIFQGFIKGIPDGVLSGGRYDKLLQKMGKHCGAIGFAVYLDLLSRLNDSNTSYDVDAILLYDEDADAESILHAADELRAEGLRVLAQKKPDGHTRAKQYYRLSKGGIERLEEHD